MLARGLGNVNYFTEPEARELLELKKKWGFSDPRNELKNCDICANDIFRASWKASGVERRAFQPPSYCPAGSSTGNGNAAPPPASTVPADNEQEMLIQSITDQVMGMLSSK
jgi:L-fuculose-phosphate aldolase